MSLDLPVVSDLDALSDPSVSIIMSMERAKEWLLVALRSDDIEQIVELKSQAEAIRVYTVQKQLGHDAELSAAEIVRRAERCIGLAIRKGQEEGRIAKVGEVKHYRANGLDALNADIQTTAEATGRTRTQISHEAYPLSDGITDDQFDAAISTAKAEKNLSRANVVRKVKGEPTVDRWASLAELADSGNTADQIAAKLGVTREGVKKAALRLGVDLRADRVMGKARRLDHNRVLREFVRDLEALAPTIELIDFAKVDPVVLKECAVNLAAVLREFDGFRRRVIKEANSGEA